MPFWKYFEYTLEPLEGLMWAKVFFIFIKFIVT